MPRDLAVPGMTPAAFRFWRSTMGYTQVQAAEALGMSEPRVEEMEAGVKKGKGTPTSIPVVVAMACSALDAKIGPYAWDKKLGAMPPAAFTRWRGEMGRKRGVDGPLELKAVAELLALASVDTVLFWERGVRRDGKPAPINRPQALALNALLHGLGPWTRER